NLVLNSHISVSMAVYSGFNSVNDYSWIGIGSANMCYGPLNFAFVPGRIDKSLIVGLEPISIARNDFGNWVGMTVRTRSTKRIAVTQLGRYVYPGNSQNVTVK